MNRTLVSVVATSAVLAGLHGDLVIGSSEQSIDVMVRSNFWSGHKRVRKITEFLVLSREREAGRTHIQFFREYPTTPPSEISACFFHRVND